MAVHSRHRRGNLLFWDTHRMRIVDAIGKDVSKWELRAIDAQDAGGTATDPRGYTTTVVEVGAGTSEAEASDEAGFTWELVTAANENDGISIQADGEQFRPTGRDIYFGIELQADEATQVDFLVGLAISDTALLGGLSDGIYFEKLDGGTGISGVTEKNSTETQTDSLGTFAANTNVILEFYFDGTSVYFFVNGALAATHTANIPDDEPLTPSIELLAGSAAARRMKIAWARAIAIS